MRVRILGQQLLERFIEHESADDDVEVLVGITHADGKVVVDLSTDHLDQLEMDPVDALRIALALKQHAEIAEQQRKAMAASA